MSSILFENKNNFDILLIKESDINFLDWKDPEYIKNICNQDIYTVITTNSENFLKDIHSNLKSNENINLVSERFNIELETQIICELKEYTYELLHLILYDENGNRILNNDNINDVATLLNLKEKYINYNSILIKNYLPINNKSSIIINSSIDDIKIILDSRANTKIVTYDGDDWKEEIFIGDLENYAKEFFDDKCIKLEIPFLKHNINIWYEIFEGKNINICGTLIKKPIYKCFWFTMNTDEFRGSLSLDEVQKIIKISHHLEFPYTTKDEWIAEEFDEYNRLVIKNKYRILDFVNNFF